MTSPAVCRGHISIDRTATSHGPACVRACAAADVWGTDFPGAAYVNQCPKSPWPILSSALWFGSSRRATAAFVVVVVFCRSVFYSGLWFAWRVIVARRTSPSDWPGRSMGRCCAPQSRWRGTTGDSDSTASASPSHPSRPRLVCRPAGANARRGAMQNPGRLAREKGQFMQSHATR